VAPAVGPPPPFAGPPALAPRHIDDEALRLARELRGTIEELLRARRTVELQREELARTAAQDPLTGVASRRAILDRLAVDAAEARRYTHPVAVMLLDVDDFSAINAAHGFTIGDTVLRELALRLRLRMRGADALGRLGNDGFMAILPHTDERGAAVFADALRQRLISRPIVTDAGELTISVSIGVAFMRPGMDLSPDELLAAADEALASAKAAGGNRIGFDRRHGLVRLEERRSSAG
jgi:diguanylate cyclase (GGDEF)-like protein